MADFDLDSTASQSGFARLVGVSQQAIGKQVSKGVFPPDGSYSEWLKAYCDKLRTEASGRYEGESDPLKRANIEDKLESAAEKRQRRLLAAGELLIAGDVESLVFDMVSQLQSSVIIAGEKIIEEIESKHSIEIDDDTVNGPLRSALGHAASRVEQFSESLLRNQSGAST